MKKMKKLLITIISIFVFSTSLLAQIDVKLNLLGLAAKNYGIGAEYHFNENISAGIFCNVNNWFSYDMIEYSTRISSESSFSSLSISPEISFYADEKDKGKMLLSVYSKYQNSTIYNLKQAVYVTKYTTKEVLYNVNSRGIILGVGIEQKWMINLNFFVYFYFGMGYAVFNEKEYSDSRVEKYIDLYTTNLSNIDPRAQIGIGYRIKYNNN